MKIEMRCAALLFVLIAILLRSVGLSHGVSFHPDERHIIMTISGMSWDNLNPKTFAYGSLPFYLIFLVSRLLSWVWPAATSYDGLFLVGRGISVAFGVAAVWLTYELGFAVSKNKWIALVAAFLLAVNPFHIQLSRYATVDGILTTFNLVVLYSLVRFVNGASKAWLWMAAVATGLSLSTKVSSLSLLVPLVFGLALSFNEKRFYLTRAFWLSLLGMTAAVLAVSLLTQPYAIIDYKTFISNISEQVNMVRGIWRPPYTVQYVNTPPYLYHLQQMFWYTVGPVVFTFSVAGLLLIAVHRSRYLSKSLLLLFVWAAIMFLVIGRYQVKFPRYLLPVYPLIMLTAAIGVYWFWEQVKLKCSSEAAALVIGLLLCHPLFVGIASASVYSKPHPYSQASNWIYQNVERNSKILGVHWDDKLPLHLPGFNPREYGYHYEGAEWELAIYEPESSAKTSRMAEQLSQADYLILPTQRTYGSVVRAPDEYEVTNRLFSLLFSGDLGYSLVASFKNYPALFGITVNDDEADESISVYDHPKVLVFKNTAKESSQEIARILRESTSTALSRSQLLKLSLPIDSGNRLNGDSGVLTTIFWALCWYVLILFLSFILLPVFQVYLPDIRDGVYAFCRSTSVALLGLLALVLGNFAGFTLNAGSIAILILLLAVISAQFAWYNRGHLQPEFKCIKARIFRGEALFAFTCVAILVLRCWSPEIFWGEKPMDFTFLNYFTRLNYLPAGDPWFYRESGAAGMHYYYLGFFAYSLIIKLTGVPTGIAYNLIVATVGAAAIVALYGVLSIILRSWKSALVGALTIILISNLDVLYLWLVSKRELNFDLFWASSRTLASPVINEYPLWSIIFADVHPHFMALPVMITLIGMALYWLIQPKTISVAVTTTAVAGIIWGLLLGLNSWDAILGVMIVGVVALIELVSIVRSPHEREERISVWLSSAASFCAVAFVLWLLLSEMLGGGQQVGLGYVYPNEFNSFNQVIRHLGIWLVPILCCSLVLVIKHRGELGRKHLMWVVSTVVLIVGLPVSLSLIHGITDQPLGVIAISIFIVALGSLLVYGMTGSNLRCAGTLLVIGGAVVLLTELFYLMDRMNTIFKFYYPLWIILGIATWCLIYEVYQIFKTRAAKFKLAALALFCSAAILLIGFIGSAANLYIMIPFKRVPGPRPTLDGTAYLESLDGDESKLIRFINENIGGPQPIIEAHGNSYAEFTRVSMNTGLPTVLGWEHHVHQRGASRQEIERRKRDLEELYTTTDPVVVREIASRYGVELIVVGNVERRKFGERGGVVFNSNGIEGIEIVKQFGPVALLKVAK